jgi:hypothetical protein
MQRRNSGERDTLGRFGKGNGHAFKKGRSGNPKGRPKSAILSDELRRKLGEPYPGAPQGRTWADAIAEALIARAVAGDVAAAKEIADRTEGKARPAVVLPYTEREKLRIAVRGIMDDSGCTREEAIRTFAMFRPEILALLDED